MSECVCKPNVWNLSCEVHKEDYENYFAQRNRPTAEDIVHQKLKEKYQI